GLILVQPGITAQVVPVRPHGEAENVEFAHVQMIIF
ncbi:hypothetical protein MNBD_GAMMA11-2087, partial [hydrothermal vent metagenome]